MVASLEALLREVPVPAPERLDHPATPNLAAAQACVDWMELAITHLNRTIGFEDNTSAYVHDLVLACASQAAVFWLRGWSEQARESLLHSWIDQSLALEPTWKLLIDFRAALACDPLSSRAAKLQASEWDREFLLVFGLAVAKRLGTEQVTSQARQSLRQLLERLELSTADLSQWLGVPTETVDQWESARTAIPPATRAALAQADDAVSRLLAIFRPERLPQVIRQKADIFEGESARDWILRGRIQDVADLYESAFAYQG